MIWLQAGDAPPGLVPHGVQLADTVAAIAAVGRFEGELYPAELDYLSSAVDSRRREFSTGRKLARQALARLGAPGGPILRRPDRAPVWPSGVSGSISHCPHCAVAVVSRGVRFMGVDIECRGRVSPRTHTSLFTPAELARGEPTALFSAKEAVFKAVHPITREQVEFLDAEVVLDLPAQRFRVRYLGASPRSRIMEQLSGVVMLTDDHVLTLAYL